MIGTGAVTIRSGVSKLLFWMGPALILVGVVMGIGGVVAAVLTGDTSLVGMLILTAVGGVAGGLMHAAGRRARVEVSALDVRWFPVIGAPTNVAWEAVQQVEVPVDPSNGRAVRLLLRDGRRLEISALSMSTGDGGAWADSGYLNAGQQLVEAHQGWLQAHLR